MVNVCADFHDLAAELVPEHSIGFEMVLALDNLEIRAADPNGLDL